MGAQSPTHVTGTAYELYTSSVIVFTPILCKDFAPVGVSAIHNSVSLSRNSVCLLALMRCDPTIANPKQMSVKLTLGQLGIKSVRALALSLHHLPSTDKRTCLLYTPMSSEPTAHVVFFAVEAWGELTFTTFKKTKCSPSDVGTP